MSQCWGKLLIVAIVVTLFGMARGHAQTCDDSDACTMPDMCVDGECSGTPVSGGTCSDGNVCTGDDTCVSGACVGTPLSSGACDDDNTCTTNDTCAAGACQGTPVENGTLCGGSDCGNCMAGLCVPILDRQSMPCTDIIGECTQNDVCLGTLCLGTPMVCPDSDGDACTRDFCIPGMGCQSVPVLCGDCSACDPESGQCGAADEGNACDDFNECTGDGICASGACQSGIPGGTATPTVTFTPTGGVVTTPTATATGVPTGTGTATATATATSGGADTPTATNTPEATATGTPTGTAAATATNTAEATATATATATPTGTAQATATSTSTATVVGPTPTATVVGPTATATVGGPTATATVAGATPTATETRTGTATNTPLPIDATIIVGSATGEPGDTVMVEVSLETSVEVAGTQNDIAFDADARIGADTQGNPRCTVNPAINKPGTTFAFQPVGCTPGTDCTSIRALVLALDNVNPIPDGSVLYTCEVEIAEDATPSTHPLTCSNPGAGDPDGVRVGADCTNGTITIAEPTQATIVIGDAAGEAGSTVPVEVSLQTALQIAGTQNDVAFEPEARIAAAEDGTPLCTVNPAINKPQTTFAFQPPGCTGNDCTAVRALVLAFANVNPIPNGAVLYTCQIAIAADAADDTYPLTCSNAGASDPDGGAVPASCVDGEVVVGVQPTPTSTATSSVVVDTPTATATTGENTPTFTPGTPSATNTATRTATRTPRPSTEDDGCQVVGSTSSGSGWMLLVPAALLLRLRRRRQ